MLVRFVTVAGPQTETFNPPIEAIEVLLAGHAIRRVAFGGMTDKGRGGVAIDIFNGRVTGHKLEAIPERLVPLVAHISLDDIPNGLRRFAEGHDVLIGSRDHGVLLKWNGPGMEAYGAGDDTEPLH